MSRMQKILFSLVLVVFVGASVWLSFNAISRPTFEYEEQTDVGGTGVDGVVLAGFNGNPDTPIVRVYHPMVENTEGIIPEYDYGEDLPVNVTRTREQEKKEAEAKGREYVEPVPSYIEDTSRTVVAIDQFTFVSDENMQYCYIGPDVAYIDEQAFFGCFALRAIYVDDANPYYCDVDGVLYTKDMSTIILYPTYHITHLQDTNKVPAGYYDDAEVHPETYDIPEGVTRIAKGCFFKTWGIKEITLPSTLVEIGDMAFFKCESLQLIELPDGLKKIGSDAFSYCRSMVGVVYIPASVESIGHYCFYKCEIENPETRLTEIRIEVYLAAGSKDDLELGTKWTPKNENKFTAEEAYFGKTREEAAARTQELVEQYS